MKKHITTALLVTAALILLCGAALASLPLPTRAADGDAAAIRLVTSSAAPDIAGAQASSVWFGNYPQSSNEEGGFNIDPIKWRVLANANGKLFLLADQNLDAEWYHNSKVSITWKDCSLRSWLNGNSGDAFFAKAFSSGEQAAVAATTVVNDNNPEYGTAGGDDTEDKVFLLSVAEVTNPAYGFSDSYANHASRKVSSTDYAISKGVGKSTNWWWLRSPGQYAYNAAAQMLVTAGTASGGTMRYAVSDSGAAAPTSGWSGEIPEKTNAGTYYVWYKAAGDNDHNDSEPDYVTAGIGRKDLTITANDQTYVYNGQMQGEGDTGL